MKYKINGRIIETEGPLTEDQIDAITTDMRTLYGGVDPDCLLYTSPSPRDGLLSRMPSSA